MSPYRPLFVDAEAAIYAEAEQERIRERQRQWDDVIRSLWSSYEDITAIPRIGAYLNLSATWPRGLALGLSDLLRDP